MGAKSPYDRVKDALSVQSFLAFIFAYLVASDLSGAYKILPIPIGIYRFFPIIICLIGIGLNTYPAFVKDVKAIEDFAYRSVPSILGVGWVALLAIFSLQAFSIV